MISASALQRVMKCPASELLPAVDISGPWAAAGVADHEVLAERVESGELWGEGWTTEAKWVYDVATRSARQVEGRADRNYGELGPFEVPGQLDAYIVDNDEIWIADHKTGWATLPNPRDSAQLMFAALVLCTAHGKRRAKIGFSLTKGDDAETVEPRIQWEEVDDFDLDAFHDALEQMHIDVAQAVGRPRYAEGDHCKYCPGRFACPVKTAAIAQVTSLPIGAIVTPEAIAQHWDAYKTATRILGEFRGQVEAIFRDQPTAVIALPGGRELRMVHSEGNERITNAEAAMAAIAETYGAERAMDCATYTVTKSSLKVAAKKHAAKGKAAAMEREMLAVLRNNGLLERKASSSLTEVPAGSATLPPGETEPDL